MPRKQQQQQALEVDAAELDVGRLGLRAPREAGASVSVCRAEYDGGSRLRVWLRGVRVAEAGDAGVALQADGQAVRKVLALERALMQALRERREAWGVRRAACSAALFRSCVAPTPEHGTCLRLRLPSGPPAVELEEGRAYDVLVAVRGMRLAGSSVSLLLVLEEAVPSSSAAEAPRRCLVSLCGADDGDEEEAGAEEDDGMGPDEVELREHVQGGLQAAVARLEAELRALSERHAEATRLLELLPAAGLSEVIRVGELLPDL